MKVKFEVERDDEMIGLAFIAGYDRIEKTFGIGLILFIYTFSITINK